MSSGAPAGNAALDEAASRLVVLLSHERSGSHYLAEMLACGGDLASFDEVCNFDAVDPEQSKASYFGFRRQWQEAHPDLALRPDADAMGRFLDDWLAHILALKPAVKLLLDIKYGHVHNFEPGWWPSEHRPYLVKYLDRNRIAVVHLVRRNAMEAVVSAIAAEKAGVWHRRAAADGGAPAKMRVAIPNVVQRALLLQREKENFHSWLAGTRCFDVAYEDIRDQGPVKNEVLARLCDHLGIRPSRFASTLERMTPPLREVVENYGELRRMAAIFGLPGLPRG
ncbi:MAG: Stf0 family sulfotransferase [Rhizomicrobium sp.]